MVRGGGRGGKCGARKRGGRKCGQLQGTRGVTLTLTLTLTRTLTLTLTLTLSPNPDQVRGAGEEGEEEGGEDGAEEGEEVRGGAPAREKISGTVTAGDGQVTPTGT